MCCPVLSALLIASSVITAVNYVPLAAVNERLRPLPSEDGCFLNAWDIVKKNCGSGKTTRTCWDAFGLYSYNASGVAIQSARIFEGTFRVSQSKDVLRSVEARQPYGYRLCFVDTEDPTTVFMDHDLSDIVAWRYTQVAAIFGTLGTMLGLICVCFCAEYKRSPARQLYHRCCPAPDPWEWELAWLMGTHPRAGANSPLLAFRRDKLYDHHLLGLVLDFVSTDLLHPREERFHRAFESSRSLANLEPWVAPAEPERVIFHAQDMELVRVSVDGASAGDFKRSAEA